MLCYLSSGERKAWGEWDSSPDFCDAGAVLKYQNITAKINNIEIVSIHSSYEISLIKTQIIKSLLTSHFTSVKASHRSQLRTVPTN